jgi:hypothetical protein
MLKAIRRDFFETMRESQPVFSWIAKGFKTIDIIHNFIPMVIRHLT